MYEQLLNAEHQLHTGNSAAAMAILRNAIEELEAAEAQREAWANEQEAAWAIARELNSSPEALEETPW